MNFIKRLNMPLAAVFAGAMMMASFIFPATTQAATPESAGNAQGWRYVRCNSNNNRFNQCSIGRHGQITLYRRHSRSGCVRGRDWGTRGQMLWVDNGCQATFRVSNRGWGGGWRPPRPR